MSGANSSRRVVWFALSLCVLLLYGCSAANSGLPSEFGLVESGTLTIGADAAYPPHTYLDADTKQVVGLDVDLAQEIGKRLGLKVRFVTIEWKGIIPALQAKRFDLITAEMNVTSERQQVVDFSDPVFMSGHVAVARLGTTSIRRPEDLEGRLVLVPIGTTEEKEARKYGANVQTFTLLSECFRELQLGRGDAVVVDQFVASEYLKRSQGALKIVTSPWSKTESAFAFRKDPTSAKLRTKMNETLSAMRADGTYERIYSKWIVRPEQ